MELGKKKLIIIVIAVLLVAGGVGTAGYMFLVKKTAPASELEEAHAEPAAPPVYLEIPSMMVNLSGATGQNFLRIRFQLELESAEVLPQAQVAMPRIVDGLQTYLRQLSADELRGSAGTQKLQTELLGVIGDIDHHMIVKNVLIQEMLVQ